MPEAVQHNVMGALQEVSVVYASLGGSLSRPAVQQL